MRIVDPTLGTDYFVHSTAVIDDGVSVGSGRRIWHLAHLLGETEIGSECSISQNVMIAFRLVVGDRCKIQNNVSIYEGVNLEDDVFCGPSMVFTNVHTPRTKA